MSSWYLIHTKIRQERLALENLERLGFECYFPLIHAEKPRSNSALPEVQEALFPRCLFVRLSTELVSQGKGLGASAAGVSRLLSLGKAPFRISEELVASIRARAASAEQPQPQHQQQAPAEQTIVGDGSCAGMEAIGQMFQMAKGESRVMALLNVLSQQVQKTVAPAPEPRVRESSLAGKLLQKTVNVSP